MGATSPLRCHGMMRCPEETSVPIDFSGLLVVILLDVSIVVFFFVVVRGRILSPVPKIVGGGKDNDGGGWSTMSAEEQAVVTSGMKKSRGVMLPIDIVCDNLSLTIPAKDGNPEKSLLSGVNAHIKPGHLTAIMGPSGAGKTILLSAILGKLSPSWSTTGSILINGLSSIATLRHMVGYVPQDDIVHSELSVFENVNLHAQLRLSRSWSADEKEEFTGLAIKALGLQKVADVRIGDSKQAGVSGGQRKRTCIASELVSAPAVLFLDEPTTGLDSTTSMELCQILKSLAVSANLTVVMVVHQPRVEIWRELDQILLLAPGGCTVYEGPGSLLAETYFRDNLGFDFSKGNPADTILDGIAAQREKCVSVWETQRGAAASAAGAVTHAASATSSSAVPPPPFLAASFLRQITLFHRRSVLKQCVQFTWLIQDILLSVTLAAFMASAAIGTETMGLLASAYVVLNPSTSTLLTIPMVTMFYGIAIAAVVPATAIRPFGNERRQYWHEAATGSVKRLAYFIGTTTAQLYRLALTSIHFTLVIYFMLGPPFDFWTFYVMMFLSFACTDAQSVLLASFIKPRNAPILTAVAGIFIALFNGYPQIPFIGVAAHSWYMSEGLMTKVFEANVHIWDTKSSMEDSMLYTYGRFGIDVLAMSIILLILHVTSFGLLVGMYRDKQR